MRAFIAAMFCWPIIISLTACTDLPIKPQVTEKVECSTKNWAGWAYLEGSSDFPFRVRVEADGSGGLDIGAAKLFNAPLTEVVYQDQSLSFVWISNSGERRSFNGQEHDLLVDGTITWGDIAGTFVLNCSALTISPRDTEASGIQSTYYLFEDELDRSNDQVWVVDRAGYGETYARRLSDGRQRVIFPTADNLYFLGRSLYDPTSISGTFRMGADDPRRIEVSDPAAGQNITGQSFNITQTESVIDTPDGPLRIIVTKRDVAPFGIGIVMVPGSNWAVAEDVTFHTENLAAYGFTMISFDKRGFGQSPGPEDRKFEATARDAGWVADWARDQNSDISIWGVMAISRGGWIAPQIPQLDQRFDFIALTVSPAVSPYQQEFAARRAILQKDGISADLIEFADTYFQALLKFAKSGSDTDQEAYAALHVEAVSKLPEEMLGGDPSTPEDWRWWRMNGDYDPAPALSAIKIPTLLLLGAEDLRVPLEPTRTLMTAYRQDDNEHSLTVIVLPGVGHDLAIPFDGPIWALDSLGSEGIEDVRLWVLETGSRKSDE